MKRLLAGMAAVAAVAGTAFIVLPATPAQAEEVIEVCVTVTEGKSVGVTINDQKISIPVPGVPRTCVGI